MTAAFAIPGPRAAVVHRAGWQATHAPAAPTRRINAILPTQTRGSLPPARTVLAITARPGQESADLGGLLQAFHAAGTRLTLLSLTRGEASALNSTLHRLEAVRPWELQLAAGLLGVSSIAVADYPDGGLRRCPIVTLTGRVQRAITEYAADLVLVVDPALGDADDAQVARAACLAAGLAGVPVVARTWPGARNGWRVELGSEAAVVRASQRSAAAAHASQADGLQEVERRLASLGSSEQMLWLLAPQWGPVSVDGRSAGGGQRCAGCGLVECRCGREHVRRQDQLDVAT
jgi:N-acetylglucosamine malate deacetylase 2